MSTTPRPHEPNGAGAPGDPAQAPSAPEPTFAVLGARHQEHAAAPTMLFRMRADAPAEHEVFTVALAAQIHFDPAKRRYDAATRAELVDLFGEPERWAATTRSFLWRRVDVLVPSFRGTTEFDLPVPCDYDLEVAATKLVYALPDGEVPLTMHFSGTVMYRGAEGRIQVMQIPWDRSASYRLPVAAWRAMIAHHYPHSGWIRLHEDTLAELRQHAARAGRADMDALVLDLLRDRP